MVCLRRRRILGPAWLALWLLVSPGMAQTPVGRARAVRGPELFATFSESFAVHGVAGDSHVVFVLEALFDPQVHILSRATRTRLGALPEPDGGFGLPLYARVRNVRRMGRSGSRGELVVLDGPPLGLQGMAPSTLHIYRYAAQPRTGVRAWRVASHTVPLNTNPPAEPPNGLIFPAAFAFLPGGDLVVADLLALWVVDREFGHWRPALTSEQFAPSPYCSTVMVDGREVPGFYMSVRDACGRKVRIPYQLRGEAPEPALPALKGVAYADFTDEVVFNRLGSPGGLFAIDRPSLVDAAVLPGDKTYSPLVPAEIGLSDLGGDVAYDTAHPESEWVYWQRTPSEPGQDACPGAHPYSEKAAPIYRVSLLTGDVELVAESWALYDFPSVLSVLPPLSPGFPFTTLISSNMMEERLALTNALTDENHLVPNTIVPMVVVPSD